MIALGAHPSVLVVVKAILIVQISIATIAIPIDIRESVAHFHRPFAIHPKGRAGQAFFIPIKLGRDPRIVSDERLICSQLNTESVRPSDCVG